jgi:KTSC domain
MTLTTAAPVPVNSTLLASVAYDIGKSLLQLEYCDGAIYQYSAVPATIHQGLLAADSKGTYFNRHIRSRYRHTRLRRPK